VECLFYVWLGVLVVLTLVFESVVLYKGWSTHEVFLLFNSFFAVQKNYIYHISYIIFLIMGYIYHISC